MRYRNYGRIMFSILLSPYLIGVKITCWLKSCKYRTEIQIGRRTNFGRSSRIVNLRKLPEFIKIGDNCIINGEIVTFAHSGRITIGDWCYVGEGSRIWSSERISIGDRVLIAHNVNIHDTNSHPVDSVERHKHYVSIKNHGHPEYITTITAKEIVIEDDVWIGFGSIILKGVRIGKRSIIGAGSIVTTDIPPDCLFVDGSILRKNNESQRNQS